MILNDDADDDDHDDDDDDDDDADADDEAADRTMIAAQMTSLSYAGGAPVTPCSPTPTSHKLIYFFRFPIPFSLYNSASAHHVPAHFSFRFDTLQPNTSAGAHKMPAEFSFCFETLQPHTLSQPFMLSLSCPHSLHFSCSASPRVVDHVCCRSFLRKL